MAEIITVQGYAGAGKTTHSEYVRLNYTYKDMPIEHISIGKRLRAIRRGEEDSQYTELVTGLKEPIITDELATNIVFEGIDENQEGLILMDGYPREASGVVSLMEAMEQGAHKLVGSICLGVTLETSTKRLLIRGSRPGEILREGSLEEEAERRYEHDVDRLDDARRSLGRIASVQVIDANGRLKVVQKRFLGAIGRFGVELNPKFQ